MRDYIIGRETNEQKALHLAHAAVIHNDITRPPTPRSTSFDNLTTADIQRVAQYVFHAEQPHRALHPAEGAGAGGPSARSQAQRRRSSGRWAVWRCAPCCRCSPRRRRRRRRATGRPSRRRVRWRRMTSQFPPYEIRTLAERHAGRRRAASRAAGGQHPSARRRRVGAGSEGQGWRREPDGVAARPGHDDAERAADRRSDRLHRRRPGHGRRHRSVVRQRRS